MAIGNGGIGPLMRAPASALFAMVLLALLVCNTRASQAPPSRDAADVAANRLISRDGVGLIRLGVTLGAARKTVPSAAFTRASDGDGAALVKVTVAPGASMLVWAGEDDPKKPIDWTKPIRTIETFSAVFRTAEDVHPGTSVSAVNRVYGRTKAIETSEIESRRYITFDRHPGGLLFRVDETERAILSIAVSHELGQTAALSR